ncbi:vacuolar ATP synthase [Cryptosporidium bovis]|uniref:vacuolar ATP synthase n=1 Tax=Cryptosporidium bovis TaxID=310047 RepID=UPI00351AAC99|nr:vacuolar ATP synthase [Cryptosporidium bovis]
MGSLDGGNKDSQNQQYWIVACGLTESNRDIIQEELCKSTKNVTQNMHVTGFDVPFSLKFGAFDDLIKLGDDLSKHDTNVEAVLRRVERLGLELGQSMEFRIIWQRSSFTVQQYLRNFSWDHARFPKERLMKENLNSLLQSVQKLDIDLRNKSVQFAELKTAVQNNYGKNMVEQTVGGVANSSASGSGPVVVSGNLITRDLTDVITPESIDESDIINTEHILTVFVIIPKGTRDAFISTYESIDKYVVPKSAIIIPSISDKDGNEIVRVLLFRSSLENFKIECKSRKYIVRDDFCYSRERYNHLVTQREKLFQEKEKQEKYLKRMCFAGFSDIFISWIHIKAMRCFVEAVLRYGVPPKFASFLLSMDNNPSKMKKIQTCIEKVFNEKGRVGATYKSNDKDVDEEYTPYVLLQFSPHQQTI